MSAPRTEGSGFGCWPTVDQWSDSSANRNANAAKKLGHGYTLGEYARNGTWPTARATDGSKGGPNQAGSSGDLMLPSAACQWATPNAHDGRRPGADIHSTQGANLSRDAAMWPPPQAYSSGDSHQVGQTPLDRAARPELGSFQTGRWPSPTSQDSAASGSAAYSTESGRHSGTTPHDRPSRGTPSLDTWASRSGPQAPPTETPGSASSLPGPTSRRQLNPRFVEWLMGWPIGWTDIEPLALPDFEHWATARCRRLLQRLF